MRKRTRILFGFGLAVSVLTLIFAALQFDDSLNPEAAKWIQQENVAKGESQAYYYLAGIDVPASQDPIAIGKIRVEATQAKQNLVSTQKLPTMSQNLYCYTRQLGCYSQLFAHTNEIPEALKTQALILQRYQTFLGLTDYKTLENDTFAGRTLPYPYLMRGNLLLRLQAIQAAHSGYANLAIADLQKEISQISSLLNQDESVVGQMIFLNILQADIDLIAIIAQKYKTPFRPIAPVIAYQNMFEKVMRQEFMLADSFITALDKDPNLLNTNDDLPGWTARTFFKPNMTRNSFFNLYQKVIVAAKLPTSAFSDAAKQLDAEQGTERFNPRNLRGEYLLALSASYSAYIASYHNLNAKIALLNAISREDNPKVILSSLRSPFDNSPVYFSKGDKMACFYTPIENRLNNCLLLGF